MQTKNFSASCYFGKETENMLPAKMCGVKAQDEFYAKYVEHRCWNRCLQCQKKAGLDYIRPSDHVKSRYVEKDHVGYMRNK